MVKVVIGTNQPTQKVYSDLVYVGVEPTILGMLFGFDDELDLWIGYADYSEHRLMVSHELMVDWFVKNFITVASLRGVDRLNAIKSREADS